MDYDEEPRRSENGDEFATLPASDAVPGAIAPDAQVEAAAPVPTGPRCPWCSAPIGHDDDRCRSCGALLTPQDQSEIEGIPGLTEVDPKLRDYKPKPQKPQLIVDFLIQYVEEDETAEAARKRLIRPKKGKNGEAATEGAESEEATGTAEATAPDEDVDERGDADRADDSDHGSSPHR